MARSVPELSAASDARRELRYELISGLSGLGLALFMWGHMLLVGSILTGAKGFDWLATFLEDYFIAQPTVVVITALFVIHAVTAARKIPAKLKERRQMQAIAKGLKTSRPAGLPDVDRTFRPHVDSMLWIWQVRTGLVLLVLGSFHIVLLTIDVLTPIYGDIVGIEAATSMARVAGGMWLPYAILLVCVEFHASVGLYRLAIKWGVGSSLSRKTLKRIEQVILVVFLGLGAVVLAVLAGWLEPPLAFLLEGGS